MEGKDYTIWFLYPEMTVCKNGNGMGLKYLYANQIYSILVESKTRFPRGLLKWREFMDLSDAEIK